MFESILGFYILFYIAGSLLRLFVLPEGPPITKLKILNIFNPLNGFYFLVETMWIIGFIIKKFWNLPLK